MGAGNPVKKGGIRQEGRGELLAAPGRQAVGPQDRCYGFGGVARQRLSSSASRLSADWWGRLSGRLDHTSSSSDGSGGQVSHQFGFMASPGPLGPSAPPSGGPRPWGETGSRPFRVLSVWDIPFRAHARARAGFPTPGVHSLRCFSVRSRKGIEALAATMGFNVNRLEAWQHRPLFYCVPRISPRPELKSREGRSLSGTLRPGTPSGITLLSRRF